MLLRHHSVRCEWRTATTYTRNVLKLFGLESIDGGLIAGERQRPCSSPSTRGGRGKRARIARQFRVYSRILTWHTHAGPTCNGYDVYTCVQTIGIFNSMVSSFAPCDSSPCLLAYSCLGPRCLICASHVCGCMWSTCFCYAARLFRPPPPPPFPETQPFPSRFLYSFNHSVSVSVCRP